jgi:hypothetical protein
MVYTFNEALTNKELKIGTRRGNFISLKSPAIQTPRLFIPYGLSEFDNGTSKKLSLDLFVGTSNEAVQYVNYVDSSVRNNLSSISDEEFSNYFKPSIQNGTVRFKVDEKTVFIQNGSKISDPKPHDFRHHTAMAIITPSLVYFFNQRIGLTWYIEEIVIFDKNNSAQAEPKFI